MEAAAALSTPRVALDARACAHFSPSSTLPSSRSPNLRLTARPRAVAAAKPRFLNPHPDPAGDGGRGARDVVAMVVPFLRGTAWEQPPPDLASFLYKNRIVYLGMCLVPSVTELMLAEFLYLQYEDAEKPIYLYINSTGTTKNGEKLGYETEALAVYDAMRYVKVPIFTLCVGNAWGEAALLLAAGAKGNRAALPSSTIMIRQPIGRFQGQATDVDIARKEIRNVKIEMVHILTKEILNLGIKLFMYLPTWMLDKLVLFLCYLVFGNTSKHGLRRPAMGPFARQLKSSVPPVVDVGTYKKIKSGEIQVLPAIRSVHGSNVEFTDGRRHPFDAIVFATGYRSAMKRWLQVDDAWLTGDDKGILQKRCPKAENGLYYAGFSGRGIQGSGTSAEFIAQDISKPLHRPEGQARPVAATRGRGD